MLVVYQNQNKVAFPITFQSHVSPDGFFHPSHPIRPESVSTITADGDELEFIRTNFTGIPMYNGPGRTVTFTGETAAFIAHNIKFR